MIFNSGVPDSPQEPCFKESSNDLNENITIIFDELNNSSTLKDDFKQSCNKALIDNNSKSIIDFNVDPLFNRRTYEINCKNYFDRIKQIDRENNKVIYDSNRRNHNNNNSNSSGMMHMMLALTLSLFK